MVLRGRARLVARLSCAAAAPFAFASPAFAQQAPTNPAELDPSAPLDPMPDLGVDWPDMDQKDAPPPPVAQPPAGQPAPAVEADLGTEDGSAKRRYLVAVTGLVSIGNSAELIDAFEKQSVLKADRKQHANAAQIDRRSRADADLLAELLHAAGYYDALVAPRIESRGRRQCPVRRPWRGRTPAGRARS